MHCISSVRFYVIGDTWITGSLCSSIKGSLVLISASVLDVYSVVPIYDINLFLWQFCSAWDWKCKQLQFLRYHIVQFLSGFYSVRNLLLKGFIKLYDGNFSIVYNVLWEDSQKKLFKSKKFHSFNFKAFSPLSSSTSPPPINGSKIQCGESSLKVFIFLQETGSYSVISLVHKKNI